MRRCRIVPIALAFPLLCGPLAASAQFRAPRSADYLFITEASDARTLWVNPASLGASFEATLTAEFYVARNDSSEFALAQFSVGFSSRGFGFGFRRDRFGDSTAGNAFRLGFGRSMRRLTVGGSLSLYTGETDQRAGDVGVRYLLLKGLEVGAVIEHIGKPTVRGVRLPLTGTGGATLNVLRGALALSAQATAADREATSGYDLSYRGGGRLGIGGALPMAVLGTVLLNDDFDVTRVALGFQIGGPYRGVLVGDGIRGQGGTLDGVSLTGIAAQPLGSR